MVRILAIFFFWNANLGDTIDPCLEYMYEYSLPHVATISPDLKINLSNKIAIHEKSNVTLITRPIKVGTYDKA